MLRLFDWTGLWLDINFVGAFVAIGYGRARKPGETNASLSLHVRDNALSVDARRRF